MISIIEMGALLNPDRSPSGKSTVTLVGLSTDSKPTSPDIGNGSMFLEMDTGSIYFYNGEEWLEFAGSGGGGGQGGSGMLVINCDSETFILDKTWSQIHAADAAVIIIPDGEESTARCYVTGTATDGGDYWVYAVTTQGGETVVPITFIAGSEDGHPSMDMGD